MKLVVTRAFLLEGKLHKVGTSFEVADRIARELIHSGKAEKAPGEPPAPPAGPLTTETAPAIVKGKAAKGEPHAGK